MTPPSGRRLSRRTLLALVVGVSSDAALRMKLESNARAIVEQARLTQFTVHVEIPASLAGAKLATAPIQGGTLLVPLAGLIDLDAEKARITKELAKSEADRASLEKRLGDEKFVGRAPQDLVAKERVRLGDLVAKCEKLAQSLAQFR